MISPFTTQFQHLMIVMSRPSMPRLQFILAAKRNEVIAAHRLQLQQLFHISKTKYSPEIPQKPIPVFHRRKDVKEGEYFRYVCYFYRVEKSNRR